MADNKESKKKEDSTSEEKIKGLEASQSQVTSGSWDSSSLARTSSFHSLDFTSSRSNKSHFESTRLVSTEIENFISRSNSFYNPDSIETTKETSKKWIITGVIAILLVILSIIKWLL